MEGHHKHHPIHRWGELLKEVGIIVLGVLIALAAEQAVEAWHWREKVAVVRSSIMGELANDRARWEMDQTSASCTLRDIDRLDRWARGATARAVPSLFHQADMLWMHSSNWAIATNSQALDHFPLREQLDFASLYDGIAHRQVEVEKEAAALDRVRTLAPLADDPQGRRELRAALGDLKEKIASVVGNNGYMIRHFDALGVKPDRRDFAADVAACTS